MWLFDLICCLIVFLYWNVKLPHLFPHSPTHQPTHPSTHTPINPPTKPINPPTTLWLIHEFYRFECSFFKHPDVYKKALLGHRYSNPAGQKFDASVDLWSLGVTLYHVATGRLPFQPYGGRKNKESMSVYITSLHSKVSISKFLFLTFIFLTFQA